MKSPRYRPKDKLEKPFRQVLSLNAKINSLLELDPLLSLIMKTAEGVMRAKASSLMLLDERKNELVFRVASGNKGDHLKEKFRVKVGEGIAGWVAKTGKPVIVDNPRNDKRFAQRFDQATGFKTQALICVPLLSKGKKIGVLEAMNPIGRNTFSGKDLELFEAFAEQAAIAIDNSRLHKILLDQKVAEQELKIAREIQQRFLPRINPDDMPFDIFCYNRPARCVSGDFYDVQKTSSTSVSIILGDVSGKGIPAALYMVKLITDFRYLITHNLKTDILLSQLNRNLIADSYHGFFATALHLVYEHAAQAIRFTNAGHHSILIRRRQREKIISVASSKSIPLGISEEFCYTSESLSLEPGDLLFIYTDGLIESRNPSGEEYSIERLARILEADYASATDCGDKVLEDLNRFGKNADPHDDLTFIAIRIK
ncbi:MAG: SpoIIE family protein phosphatase [Candidatus Omnitrophica bacterium]|nr:SpoIIE family protein phosphatase [Candidatus Omnitrophota bacterium]